MRKGGNALRIEFSTIFRVSFRVSVHVSFCFPLRIFCLALPYLLCSCRASIAHFLWVPAVFRNRFVRHLFLRIFFSDFPRIFRVVFRVSFGYFLQIFSRIFCLFLLFISFVYIGVSFAYCFCVPFARFLGVSFAHSFSLLGFLAHH